MSINAAGPVNAASYIPAGLPNSGIAQGGIFIVKGTGLCETGFTKRTVLPYDTVLKDTSIRISSTTRSVDAYMVYVYGGLKNSEGATFDQIAAILPSGAPVGTVNLTVTYKGNSVTVSTKVLTSGPGLFSLSQGGHGPGVISDNVTYQFNTITNAFNDKTWTNLWVTGLGPLPSGADNVEPPVGSLNVGMELWVGGHKVDPSRIAYYGRAPKNAGLDQVAFLPPSGVSGCAIPVFLKVGNFISNTVTMSLGSALRCSDPLSATPSQMDRIEHHQPLNISRIVAARADFKVQTKDSAGVVKTAEGTADVAYGRFSRYDAAYAPFSQEVVGLPSLGNCVVTQAMSKRNGSLDQAVNLTADPVPHTALNAGDSVALNGGQWGTRQVAAPATPPNTGGTPVNIELTFENKGDDDAHVFSQTLGETFPGGTKLSPGETRVRSIPYSLISSQVLNFSGGRNGTVIAKGAVYIDGTFSKVRITFDESSTLKIVKSSGTTSSDGLAMFQSTLSSGYYKLLGADLKNAQLDPDAKIDPLFLNGGVYTATTAKTADVGAISTSIQIPASSVDWPEKDSVDAITRAQGFTVHWTGGDAAVEHIAIYGHSAGASSDTSNAPGSAFVCTAPVTAKQFTIPANILLQLPESQSAHEGILSIGTSPLSSAGNFTAEGVESGRFTFTQTVIRSVTYK